MEKVSRVHVSRVLIYAYEACGKNTFSQEYTYGKMSSTTMESGIMKSVQSSMSMGLNCSVSDQSAGYSAGFSAGFQASSGMKTFVQNAAHCVHESSNSTRFNHESLDGSPFYVYQTRVEVTTTKGVYSFSTAWEVVKRKQDLLQTDVPMTGVTVGEGWFLSDYNGDWLKVADGEMQFIDKATHITQHQFPLLGERFDINPRWGKRTMLFNGTDWNEHGGPNVTWRKVAKLEDLRFQSTLNNDTLIQNEHGLRWYEFNTGKLLQSMDLSRNETSTCVSWFGNKVHMNKERGNWVEDGPQKVTWRRF